MYVSKYPNIKVKEMGNINKMFKLTKIKKDCNTISERQYKDFDKIKTIWQIIEKDSVYYGFAMCTTLFKKYPQYAKYFEDETIPEFVREAKIKKKFTAIYEIISTLFVNYQDKPTQRNYFLGYIAMVHKDMGLTLQDFENFMSSVLETLCTELPIIMTNEYILIQMQYLNILKETILTLMDEQRIKLHEVSRSNNRIEKCYIWCCGERSETIYGYPLQYWLYKERYWEYRRAIWVSLDQNAATENEIPISEQRKMKMQSRRKSAQIRRVDRRRRSKAKCTHKHVSSNSDHCITDERL